MKKIQMLSIAAVGAAWLGGCSLFELDNKDLPAETLRGRVVDAATGEPVLTDQGGEGIRVRLTETSYKGNANPTHNPDFFCRPDGTFQNTKLFKGTYTVQLDGPFVPLYVEDASGTPQRDETRTIEISGVKEETFEVQPFLKVEWVEEPSVAGNILTAKIRVTRATPFEDCKAAMSPITGYADSWLNLESVMLYISYSPYVGYRERDARWTNEVTGANNALLGQVITIRSRSENPLPEGRTFFVRPAARVQYGREAGAIKNCYNYGETKIVLN